MYEKTTYRKSGVGVIQKHVFSKSKAQHRHSKIHQNMQNHRFVTVNSCIYRKRPETLEFIYFIRILSIKTSSFFAQKSMLLNQRRRRNYVFSRINMLRGCKSAVFSYKNASAYEDNTCPVKTGKWLEPALASCPRKN